MTINPNSTLAPGPATGTGILTITGTQTAVPTTTNSTLNLASGSNFDLTLNGAIAGSGYDQLALVGTVSLNGANLNLTLGAGFNPDGLGFRILDNRGAQLVNGTFAQGTLLSASNDTGTYNFTINYAGGDGNDIVVFANAVPEPGTYALVAGGLVLLLGVVRARQQRRQRWPALPLLVGRR